MTYTAAKRKIWLETIAMFPFVLAGRLAGYIFKPGARSRVFLFFPNGDIGGSPQVNIDLTNCIRDTRPLIIFSKKPGNNQFREKYNLEGVTVFDIHRFIDNKLFHFINFFFRGLLATWINQQENAVVLGGESIFFYKMLPHLRPHVHCVEICHLDTWLPYSIGFIDDIDCRVFSTEKLKEKVERQYHDNNLPEQYFRKLFFTDNAISIPPYRPCTNDNLQVYFIGRGAPQKRVPLALAIARHIHDKNLPVQFNFVGDVEKLVDTTAYPFCEFYGNIKGEDQMDQVYQSADVLLMTSSFEGLPIVVMQMMAHAKTVVSTAVNGIPDYIHHGENGLLIHSTSEKDIIEEGAAHIETLLNDPALRRRLGNRSREIAIEKFSKDVFCKQYRRLMELDKS
ncbi:MAG: glycosyltransferase family 4 protein [Bacteroidota bacterium]